MEKRSIDGEKTVFKSSYDELRIFRSAVEHSPVAIGITDKDGHHYYHNTAFRQMFGYEVEELNDAPMDRLYVDASAAEKIFNKAVREGSWEGEIEMMEKSGQILQVLLHTEAIRDENGGLLSFLGMYTDITHKKKTETKLTYQNEYMSTLHSISLGMVHRLDLTELLNAIIVRASRITRIPNGFLHLYDPDQNVLEIKAACGNIASHIGFKIKPGSGLAGKVFETGEPMIVDNYQLWEGKIKETAFEKIYSIIGIPLVSGSRIEGVIGLSHDMEGCLIDPEIISILEEFSAIAQIAITNAKLFENQKLELEKRVALEKERKEMELRLHQSQRMEAIGTLAGGIAHDFNNILSAIMGFAQLAIGDVQKGSTLEEDLNEIYTASLRARDLVQQILTFARQSDEHMHAVKLSLIAKEVLKFIRSSIPSTITIHQDIQSTSKIMGNPAQIYQIFLNLFTNAAQAMEKDGGTLKVVIADEVLKKARDTLTMGRYVRAAISDTGMGIDKAHIHQIYDPYFTTKHVGEGTGLGLAVVHGAVKTMGGEIFVKSTVGQGTIFTLYFPVAKNEVSEQGYISIEEKIPSGRQEHVLFVDDEIPITKLGKRMLESLNYKVTVFSSSLDALACFRSAPDGFNVVVTDMTMPDMTGEKLAQELKKIRPDIPIILCTGFSKYLSESYLKEKGIQYYLNKPIAKTDLAVLVRRVLDNHVRIK